MTSITDLIGAMLKLLRKLMCWKWRLDAKDQCKRRQVDDVKGLNGESLDLKKSPGIKKDEQKTDAFELLATEDQREQCRVKDVCQLRDEASYNVQKKTTSPPQLNDESWGLKKVLKINIPASHRDLGGKSMKRLTNHW